jgi:hypothetical protein
MLSQIEICFTVNKTFFLLVELKQEMLNFLFHRTALQTLKAIVSVITIYEDS